MATYMHKGHSRDHVESVPSGYQDDRPDALIPGGPRAIILSAIRREECFRKKTE